MAKWKAFSSYGMEDVTFPSKLKAVEALQEKYQLAPRHVEIVKGGGRVQRGNLEAWVERVEEVRPTQNNEVTRFDSDFMSPPPFQVGCDCPQCTTNRARRARGEAEVAVRPDMSSFAAIIVNRAVALDDLFTAMYTANVDSWNSTRMAEARILAMPNPQPEEDPCVTEPISSPATDESSSTDTPQTT